MNRLLRRPDDGREPVRPDPYLPAVRHDFRSQCFVFGLQARSRAAYNNKAQDLVAEREHDEHCSHIREVGR